jgi:hypothetical protein
MNDQPENPVSPLDLPLFPPPDAVSFAKWVQQCEQLTDDSVWLLACMTVAAAGIRAARLDRRDIERICLTFGIGMHEAADTPLPPMQRAADLFDPSKD